MVEDILPLARALVEAPSPSGDEFPALAVAERALGHAGLAVERQPVGGSSTRFNLFASCGTPKALLTTHLDTVPGTLPVEVRDGVLHGRGACDAKGIAASMITAAADLVARGRRDFGVLFVVGEETTSDGAIAADALLASGDIEWRPRFALFGEPTGLRWVSAHPGVVMATLSARGRPSHSSRPDPAGNAIHLLLDWIAAVRREPWPADPALGPTLLQVGRIGGGTAANVAAEHASADVMFRSTLTTEAIVSRLRALAPERAEVTVTCSSAPMRFRTTTPDASNEPLDAAPVAFSTDAPFLQHAGAPWLFGPGDIAHAHANDEQVRGTDLALAAQMQARWVEACLAADGGRS